MLPRRALKVILICIIAIWASAGICPDRAAYGAVAPPQIEQTATGSGGGTAPARDQQVTTVNPTGDPDAYTQTGDAAPLPGSGNDQPPQDSRVVIIVLMILFGWFLQIGY
jgi:hypothetical protein